MKCDDAMKLYSEISRVNDTVNLVFILMLCEKS